MPATKPLKLKLNDGTVLPGAIVFEAEYHGGEWYLLVLCQKRLRAIKLSDIAEAEEVL